MSNKQFFIQPDDFQIYRNMDKYLIPSDLVLAILSISDVKQYKKMQMLVFLSWKGVFNDITFDLAFFPSGPAMISDSVDHSINTLQTRKLITVSSIENESLYSITDSGRSKLMDKLDIVKTNLRDLKEKRMQWDDWSIRKTFDYISENYPQYIGKSEQNQNPRKKIEGAGEKTRTRSRISRLRLLKSSKNLQMSSHKSKTKPDKATWKKPIRKSKTKILRH